MAPLYKLRADIWKVKNAATKEKEREDLIKKEQYWCGEKPVVYPKETNQYDPSRDLKIQALRYKLERVKEVVCRFDKKLVAQRLQVIQLTLLDIIGMEGWRDNADVRRVMDLDGFDRKVQLFKAQRANGEAVQGVMGA